MKKIATVMAAIAMLAASSVASAGDNLWFTMISAPAGITATSGPGQALEITKTDPAPATVRIGVNLTCSQYASLGADRMAYLTLALASTPGGAFANGAVGAGYDQAFGGIVNGSSSAAFGAGSSSANGPAGIVYSFDLVLGLGSGATPVAVTGDFGADGGRYNNNFLWFGNVGSNGLSYGAPGYIGPGPNGGGLSDTSIGWGLAPVITVTPEPTTLVLLGLGAVALLRRRK